MKGYAYEYAYYKENGKVIGYYYVKHKGNGHVINHSRRFGKARKIAGDRAVPWANEAKLKQVYRLCPTNLSIDHVIPMKGELVSGLHVAENLDYVFPNENHDKGNSFTPYREVKGKIVEYYK